MSVLCSLPVAIRFLYFMLKWGLEMTSDLFCGLTELMAKTLQKILQHVNVIALREQDSVQVRSCCVCSRGSF